MITLGNVFDDKAKGGRELTENEVALARSVFGDKIDYDQVRIYNHKIPGLGTTAMAPNGNIYLPKSMHLDDMTVSSHARGLFVHEMTHVWQHQQGRFVIGEAVGDWFKDGFNRKAAYKYDEHGKVAFEDMSLEGQAEIMRDHYMAQDRGKESLERGEILAAAGMDFTVCPFEDKPPVSEDICKPETLKF